MSDPAEQNSAPPEETVTPVKATTEPTEYPALPQLPLVNVLARSAQTKEATANVAQVIGQLPADDDDDNDISDDAADFVATLLKAPRVKSLSSYRRDLLKKEYLFEQYERLQQSSAHSKTRLWEALWLDYVDFSIKYPQSGFRGGPPPLDLKSHIPEPICGYHEIETLEEAEVKAERKATTAKTPKKARANASDPAPGQAVSNAKAKFDSTIHGKLKPFKQAVGVSKLVVDFLQSLWYVCMIRPPHAQKIPFMAATYKPHGGQFSSIGQLGYCVDLYMCKLVTREITRDPADKTWQSWAYAQLDKDRFESYYPIKDDHFVDSLCEDVKRHGETYRWWKRRLVIDFLQRFDEAAKLANFQYWHALYNDIYVIDSVNAALRRVKSPAVEMKGSFTETGKINYHGPKRFQMHIHVDIHPTAIPVLD